MPDAVSPAKEVAPETVKFLATVAFPLSVVLPLTDASDCAVNAPAMVRPPFAVINPEAVRAAVVVAPETASPF